MVEWKKLGDIMTIVRGASPRPIKNYITSSEDGVNWIKIGDVPPDTKFITSSNEKITKEGAEKSRFLHAGDFVLSNSMSFGRPYILKIDGCIHDGWIAMSDFEHYVSSGYLYEILNSNSVQDYWKMKANNGGAMTNLNSDIVRETVIPIPSLSEQTRIVGILDTFTASIENLKQQISERRKQYEYYRDQLLDLALVKWPKVNLKDVAIIKNGKDYKNLSEGNIPVYGTGGIMTYVDKFASESPSVLLPRKGSVDNIYYVDEPFWTVDTLYWTEINTNKILPKYLFVSLRRYNLKDYAYGGARPSLSQPILYKLEISLPSLQEQSRIVSILDTFEASISNLEAQLKQREKQYEYYRNKLLTFE